MSEDRIEGALRNGVGHIQDAAGGLVGDTETQLRGKFNQVAGSAQNTLGKAKDRAQDVYGDVTDRARHLAAEGRHRAQHGYDDFEDMLRGSPVPAVAIAMGIGFVVGLLLSSSGAAYATRR